MQQGRLETMRLYASLRTGCDFGMLPRNSALKGVIPVGFVTMLSIATGACCAWLCAAFDCVFSVLFLRLNGVRFRGAPRFNA